MVTLSTGLALLWLYLHPLAGDEVNLLLILLIFLVSVPLNLQLKLFFVDKNRIVFLLLVLLFVIAMVSTIVSGGGLLAVRDVVLIGVTVSLGLSLSVSGNPTTVLWGVTGGGLLVAAVGWALSIRRNGLWTGFDYDFIGVTDGGEPETFSAWVGLVTSIALIRGKAQEKAFAFLSAIFLGFTLISTGQTSGVLTAISLTVAVVFVFILRKLGKRGQSLMMAALALGLLIVAFLVSSRGLATQIAARLGETKSVEWRYEIWESALGSMSLWGWFLGHGSYFWNTESPTRLNANTLQNAAGLPSFSHAHNAYLDLFLSFGVGGVLVLLALIAIVIRRSLWTWKTSNEWTLLSLPVLLVFSLALQMVSQSNLVFRPLGWLYCGILVGLLAFSREQSRSTTKFWWAPSGSNRRPTD